MKEIVEKLVRAEQEMAAEKGAFLLFAVFLREDAPDVWDLIVASPWVAEDKPGSLRYISDKVRSILDASELVKLSRIVLIEPDNPALAAFQQAIHVEHRIAEFKDSVFSGLRIKHAYLITSRQDTNTEPSKPATHPK
ncbi:MAG: hypothetical protein A2Y76_09635 [Planctomycetes bacterium RBG_13_60_9]|nr:MAG: hypothetical protein A2Y76_09635 [Planctomycetes bacterium RBG_13_60_9]